MSRDSSRSYLHLHASHHADLFEDFTSTLTPTSAAQPPSTHAPPTPGPSTTSASHPGPPAATHTAAGNTPHLPSEDIFVPAAHQPPNPEDEDDIVPDQHAAFGITRAMAAREGRERQWRDFEALAEAVRGVGVGEEAGAGGGGRTAGASRAR